MCTHFLLRGLDVSSPEAPDENMPRGPAAPDLDRLEAALGHRFADRGLLVQAVTHRSFAHEAPEGGCADNESLEFLGDAILAFLVADRLYRAFPGLDEGRLSKHAAMLENLRTLAEMGRGLGLGEFLRLGRGEIKCGGAANDKIISDALEALLAALYLDGGLDAARAFVDRLIDPRLDGLDVENPVVDFKSALQEATQAQGLGMPGYRVVEETGPDHQKQFRVVVSLDGVDLAEGTGSTKRAAHQVAARRALLRVSPESARPGGDGEGPAGK